MTLGPILYYQCPKCGHLLALQSFNSVNSGFALHFSDGKSVFPMMPDTPDIVKCKQCFNFFWFKTSKQVYFLWKYILKKIKKIYPVEHLTLNENIEVLKLSLINTQDLEILIRKRIWWGYNDRQRAYNNEIYTSERRFEEINDKETYNLNCYKLIQMLTNTEQEDSKLMIAEIYRNLGEFDRCISIVEKEFIKTEFFDIALQIKKETEKENSWVFKIRKLPFPQIPFKFSSFEEI